VAAFAVVSIGRYGLFEMIMKTFAALKFGIVILLAILLAPSLGEVALGFVPRIPEGALINVLAIIGGVGGTYSLAVYTYWVRERGWRHSAWIPTMRTDLGLRANRPVHGVDADHRGGVALRYRHVHKR
jgi:Mn2+/Fe2+ NRAMP family transporter